MVSPPPSDKHILVLLTAFEMFGLDNHMPDESVLADACDLEDDISRLCAIFYDLCRFGWISVSETGGHKKTSYYFSPEQAYMINRYYPNSLDT